MRRVLPIRRALICSAALTLPACSARGPTAPSVPAPQKPAPPTADLVITGGLVHTMDDARSTASGIAVLGRSIVAVGDRQSVQSWIGPQTRHIRLSGHSVVPGIADAHVDLAALGRPDTAPTGSPESDRTVTAALLRAQAFALTAGLTQVHAFGLDKPTIAALRRLDETGDLRLRIYGFIDGSIEDLTEFMEAGPSVATPGRRLTVRGFHFDLDGSIEAGNGALLRPYADRKQVQGSFRRAPSLVEARARTAKERGFHVALTAHGDRANRAALDIIGSVFGVDDGASRPRIEGLDVVHPDDRPRFAELGAVAVVQPAAIIEHRRWIEQRLGGQRIAHALAWGSVARFGARIAAGSGTWDRRTSPLVGLYALATRKDPLGFPNQGWFPAERLGRFEALAAYTTAGAYASFRDDRAGIIAVGRVADLTVIDKDPLTATEESLAAMQAVLTVIDGRIEMERPIRPASPTRSSTTATVAR